MLNTHCKDCQNKSKLFLKLPGRMKFTYICRSAVKCPYTQKKEGEEIKLRLDKLSSAQNIHNKIVYNGGLK